jgi:hypothetical protein
MSLSFAFVECSTMLLLVLFSQSCCCWTAVTPDLMTPSFLHVEYSPQREQVDGNIHLWDARTAAGPVIAFVQQVQPPHNVFNLHCLVVCFVYSPLCVRFFVDNVGLVTFVWLCFSSRRPLFLRQSQM